MIVRLSVRLEIEAQSQTFSSPNLLYQEVFRRNNFRRYFEVVVVFYLRVTHTTIWSTVTGP